MTHLLEMWWPIGNVAALLEMLWLTVGDVIAHWLQIWWSMSGDMAAHQGDVVADIWSSGGSWDNGMATG